MVEALAGKRGGSGVSGFDYVRIPFSPRKRRRRRWRGRRRYSSAGGRARRRPWDRRRDRGTYDRRRGTDDSLGLAYPAIQWDVGIGVDSSRKETVLKVGNRRGAATCQQK